MNLLLINLAIYGLFGVFIVLATRYHDRKMQAIWDKWDAHYAEKMGRKDDDV